MNEAEALVRQELHLELATGGDVGQALKTRLGRRGQRLRLCVAPLPAHGGLSGPFGRLDILGLDDRVAHQPDRPDDGFQLLLRHLQQG